MFRQEGDEDHEVILERLRTNVEKDGRPFNWLVSEEEVEQERQRRELEKLRIEEEVELIEKNKLETKEGEERVRREQHAKDRMSRLQDEERDALNTKSIALRNYLNENVVPTLTEGLIETAKILPEDPVDYLAE